MIDRENTVNLMNDLMTSRHLRAYFDKYPFEGDAYLSFPEYVEKLLAQKGLRRSVLIRKMNMNRSYAYEIFNGHKRPSREKTLMLSYGLDLDFKGTQRLLLSAKHNPLHPKDKRDAILIFAKYNHHSLVETNLLLDEFNQAILD